MRQPMHALLCLAVLTGCGTTVTPDAARPAATGDGLAAPGTPPERSAQGNELPGAASPGGAGGVSSGGAPAGQPAVGGPTTNLGAGAQQGQPQQPADGPAAPSRTSRPLKVGIQTLTGGDTYLSSLGVAGSYGNTRAQAQAVVDEVNRTGGIAGRVVTPVFAAFDASSSETTAGQDQRICTAWTQDARVEAAVTAFSTTSTMHGCVQKAGVSLFAAAPQDSTHAADFRPSLLYPFDPALDRWASAHVDRLAANAYFGTKPVIGLIRFDRPDVTRTVERALKPALKRHGFRVAEEARVQPAQAASDTGAVVSQVSSAVLSFRSAGVTHVLNVLDGGGTILFFMQTAEQQNYRPRYALTSFDAPGVLQGSAPAAQLRDSVGTGWLPPFDVDAAHDPALSASGKRCLEVMRKAGQDVTSRLARNYALRVCDSLFLLQSALPKGVDVTANSVAAALAQASYVPGLTFRTAFPGARPDGAGYLRDLRYETACGCFSYRSSGTTL